MDAIPRKVKRLFFDVESSPNIVLAFRAGFKLNINHDAILQERKTICICYKWQDDKDVTTLRWSKNQDDRVMLQKFLEVADEADELVAHYGDGFDVPWFRARCLVHGLEPLPPYKTVDTKAWAAKYFLFNSNKLDYIAKFLGYGNKIKTDFDLWKDVMKGDAGALGRMCDYCAHDVVLLEKIYKRMSFCVKPKTHAGVLLGKAKWSDPLNGSTNVKLHKIRPTPSGNLQYQMKNMGTGSYFTLSATDYRLYLKSQ